MNPAEASLSEARDAFEKRRWTLAFESFEIADSEQPLEQEDLERFGETAFWLGRVARAIEIRQRAYRAYKARGDQLGAARLALKLSEDHEHRLEASISAGWQGRAERLLKELPACAEHAWLRRAYLSQALSAGDADEALRLADANLALGKQLGDTDVEVVGLHDRARALLAMGRVDEGMAVLDEAVVAAVAGELSSIASAVVFCNATIACEDLTDYRRAGEFAEAASRWCDSQDISGFPGMCRVRRVEIIRLKGDWAAAELEAKKACEELIDFDLSYAGEGFYQIGEIRLRMRDHVAADEAFSEAHRLGRDPMPGLALLRLAQDDADGATKLIARAIGEKQNDTLGRARLLPAEVAIALRLEDRERIRRAATDLEQIADLFKTHLLRAQAHEARGSHALLEGDHDLAIESFRSAVREWQATEAPWEAALARTLLGEAYLAAGEASAAGLELTAAVAAFGELGAAADADRARGFLDGSILARTGPAAPRAAQRTFMFTDIVGSTNLLEAIGDQAWSRLVAWHDTAIRRIVAERRGQEVDHAGDGFFISFETADDAVACAIAIQKTLQEHREQAGFAPDVRIGLHRAEALQTSEGYAGSGVHTAARIGALAEGGQILASRDVVASCTTEPAHEAWREVRLKGISSPVSLTVLR